ncbi:uncharacterized protein LOC132307271 isoform X2 [Cornus florida]|uniref:uncharacterized protein LOC132307271 isoform X2 n=1 Tax=Cornus florida TaxID=4283 RepID=UPI0028A051BE|nr:uncharacterized protein LOC132307271 isoform X2 [Cornus florida]
MLKLQPKPILFLLLLLLLLPLPPPPSFLCTGSGPTMSLKKTPHLFHQYMLKGGWMLKSLLEIPIGSLCVFFCDLVDEDEIYWRQKKDDDDLAWPHNSAHVISQLTQCFTNAMVGSRSWIGGIFSRSGNKRSGSNKFVDYPLSHLQEQRLQRLQERLQVSFDETCPDHQGALRALWCAAFPDIALKGLISEQWKDMGWQGHNPSTDFRGCGFISLENLLFFARTYPASFQRLLFKQGGKRATWEYPFAVAGINISFMLIQMLDLFSAKPRCLPGMNFVKLLGEDEEAFDVLYCIAFEMMDAQWLAMHASYMEFNEVLQATRMQLERELSLEDVHRIQDLPAYNLLYQ